MGPASPPFGGMANQMMLLERLLSGVGVCVTRVPTNRSTPVLEKLLGRVPGLRTAVRELFFLVRLLMAARRNDVLHVIACSHLYFFLHVVPAVLLARALGRRVMVNYRGGEASRFFSTTGRPFLGLLRRASAVTVPSGYLRKVFRVFGIDAAIVPNIVEIEARAGTARNPVRPRRFLCTRNLEPYYDVETLVRAFHIVHERVPDAHLTLVGDGSRRVHVAGQVKALHLEEVVTLTGRVHPSDVACYLKSADVFVNASVVDNQPNAILEAFASGLPVVTTSAGGIPFLVRDGVNGLLAAPGDEQALGEGMIRLATDPHLYVRLAQEGRATAEKHTWAAVWPLLKRAYGLNGRLS